jgi:hypothetical protein
MTPTEKMTILLLLRYVRDIIETEIKLSGEGYHTSEFLELPTMINNVLPKTNPN